MVRTEQINQFLIARIHFLKKKNPELNRSVTFLEQTGPDIGRSTLKKQFYLIQTI